MNASIFSTSLRPSLSTPDETSTAQGVTCATASLTFSGVRPPASISGLARPTSAAMFQSNASPLPPGSLLFASSTVTVAGGRAASSMIPSAVDFFPT